MKVFIAGHAGMVGSALLRTLPDSYEGLTAARNELDLSDYENVYRFLQKYRPDGIVLAAAKVGGIGANSKHNKEFLVNNLQIQNAVLTSACDLGIRNLVFLGSSCIYPRLASQPIKESALLTGSLEPTNEGYAIAKIAGIKLAEYIYKQFGLNFVSLMPTNLYGPNDNYDVFSSHVPAALMRKFHDAKITNQKEVIVWGTGEPRREFMHVDDLARACWHMLTRENKGELINIGTGEDITIAEFSNLMANVVGYEGKIVFDESKPDGTPRKLLDVSRAHSYGWKHEIDLKDGLMQTYAWYVDALAKGEVRGY